MQDLLVNLYDLNFSNVNCEKEIKYVRALAPNADKIIDFVLENFSAGWASEIKASLYKTNPTLFVAYDKNEIVGFAAYDATAKGFFGPIGVKGTMRGLNIGKNLLLHALEAMRFDGYAYAIIGGAGSKVIDFYHKTCNAVKINSTNSVYNRLISFKK